MTSNILSIHLMDYQKKVDIFVGRIISYYLAFKRQTNRFVFDVYDESFVNHRI
jgi:hypothetical protein